MSNLPKQRIVKQVAPSISFFPSTRCMCPNAGRNIDIAAGDRGHGRGRQRLERGCPTEAGLHSHSHSLPSLPTPHSPPLTPPGPLPPVPLPSPHSPPGPAPPRPAPFSRCLAAISRDYANEAPQPRPARPLPARRAPWLGGERARRGALWDSGGIKCTLGAAAAEGAGGSGA